MGDTGEEDVCQSWKKHELCRVSKTNLNLSIAVLVPYPEAGSHPRRELNVVTKGACSTLILFGGPGEAKSNFTIVKITVKNKKETKKETRKKNTQQKIMSISQL